jgi:hypothetical protein
MGLSKQVWLVIAVVAAAGGCLPYKHDHCGPGEAVDEGDICVCVPGHVPVYREITVVSAANPGQQRPFSACTPCGANQMVSIDKCVCVPGFVSGAAGCIPSNLGASCASEADCAAGDQKSCRLPEGYCTSSCAASADCNADADYGCATTAMPPYCKRPPVGQGRACAMMGPDPACSPEAPLCVLNSCTSAGCKTDADCSPSRRCCDLTKLGQPGLTLCLAGCP